MIKIGKAIQHKNPKNVYKIKHDWMLGDDDGDTTTTQIISDDNKDLDRFLNCCTKLEKALPGTWANILDDKTIKRCLKDDYDWFMNKANELDFEIIIDQANTFVSYQGFSMIYYDENGVAHSCEYIPTEEWRDKVITETLGEK